MLTEKLLSFVSTGHFVCCASDACFARQYGNVNSQVDMVNGQLSAIPELNDGFDAIGFSQGARSLAARIPVLNPMCQVDSSSVRT